MNRWTFYLLMLTCSWFILIQMRLGSAGKLYLRLESVGFALVQAVCITVPILLGDLLAEQHDTTRPGYYGMFVVPYMLHCLCSFAGNVTYLFGHITAPHVLAADNFELTLAMLCLVLGFQFIAMLEMLMVFFYSVMGICLARTALQRNN